MIKGLRLAAAFLALTMAAALSASFPVGAEGGSDSDSVSEFCVKDYLVTRKGVSAPDAVFSYAISPGQAVEGSEDAHEVFAGLPGAVFRESPGVSADGAAASAAFSHTDSPTAESAAPAGEMIAFATGDDKSDEQYYEKQLTVDLSGVTFPERGIYRYVISRTAPSMTGLATDSANSRYIDVFVHKSLFRIFTKEKKESIIRGKEKR